MAWHVHGMAWHAQDMCGRSTRMSAADAHITHRGRFCTDAQVQLPLAGRELTDYDCKPTETGNTILSDWSRCKEGRRKSEL